MTAERFVVSIVVITVCFVAFALFVVGGPSFPLWRWAASFGISMPDPGRIAAAVPDVSVQRLGLPATIRTYDGALLLVGVVFGWILRWLYQLPWSAIPRALLGQLLGWRNSIVSLALVVTCTVILVFY